MIHYNYTAFLQRYTLGIEACLKTDKRNFIIRRACHLLIDFDEYTQHQALKFWCDKFKLSLSVLESYITGKEIIFESDTEKLREFLSAFTINENEITGQLDIEYNDYAYTVDELEILVDEAGLSTSTLKKLLKSTNKNITVVTVYNPLNTLFLKLADNYNGEPLIHQLADCIKAYDFGDEPPGFYQNRLVYIFHKWLCKAAGQAFHISANDVMLLWVDPLGGTGKSRLNNWLFSLPELQQYYLKIGENESFMEFKIISKSKFAIDFDEMPLNKKRYMAFKSHIASETGQHYSKLSKTYESYIRQVNFIGSSNQANRERQRGYLFDDDSAMMRRIAPVEIEGSIQWERYLKDIDLSQLWGQAATEILKAKENNNNNLLNWQCDYIDLRRQNARYVSKESDERQQILSTVLSCKIGEGRLLSAGEILAELTKKSVKTNLNKYQLGNFLAANGYTYGRVRNIKGWWVK
jgi:hypothetical protein